MAVAKTKRAAGEGAEGEGATGEDVRRRVSQVERLPQTLAKKVEDED